MKVGQFIDIHTHTLRKSPDIISVYNVGFQSTEIPDQLYSFGIHPWDIKMDAGKTLHQLENLFHNHHLRIIGETGLDKIHGPDLRLQKEVFGVHLTIAEKYKLPVIIHCVKAFEEVCKMLELSAFVPGFVFHGFQKSPELGHDLTNQGYFISLGEILVSRPDRAKSILEKVNHSKLFFETDDTEYTIEKIYKCASLLSNKSVEY